MRNLRVAMAFVFGLLINLAVADLIFNLQPDDTGGILVDNFCDPNPALNLTFPNNGTFFLPPLNGPNGVTRFGIIGSQQLNPQTTMAISVGTTQTLPGGAFKFDTDGPTGTQTPFVIIYDVPTQTFPDLVVEVRFNEPPTGILFMDAIGGMQGGNFNSSPLLLTQADTIAVATLPGAEYQEFAIGVLNQNQSPTSASINSIRISIVPEPSSFLMLGRSGLSSAASIGREMLSDRSRELMSRWIPAVIILFLTFLAYAPAWHAGVIWDDRRLIFANPIVHDDGGLWRIWFSFDALDYLPVTNSGFWLGWRLFGLDPSGYHIANIFLHALGACIVWRVLMRLRVPAPWLVALIFAVHPVTVASVAWISELKNTASLVIGAFAMLSFLKYLQESRRVWYGVALVAFTLSLGAKASVVTLPVVLLGTNYWARGKLKTRDLARLAPFFVIALLFTVATIHVHATNALALERASVRPEGALSRLAASGWALGFYLVKGLWPFHLAMVYPRWNVDPVRWTHWLPLAAYLATFIALVKTPRLSTLAKLGICYVPLMLLPVLGAFDISFFRHSLVADHWQYLSLIGLVALVVAFLRGRFRALGPKGWQVGQFCAVIAVAVLMGLTWQRCFVFQSSLNLWRDNVAKHPEIALVNFQLGTVLFEARLDEEALPFLRKAAKLDAENSRAGYNLAATLARAGHYDEALQRFDRLMSEVDDHALLYRGKGYVMQQLGRDAEAVDFFQQSLDLAPKQVEVHQAIARLVKDDDFERAMKHARQMIRLAPNRAAGHFLSAQIYERHGEEERAIDELRRAVALEPQFRRAWELLGDLTDDTPDNESKVASPPSDVEQQERARL